MGTAESITTKIHVDHMIDSLAKFCPRLERLEFRWDNDTLRYVYTYTASRLKIAYRESPKNLEYDLGLLTYILKRIKVLLIKICEHI